MSGTDGHYDPPPPPPVFGSNTTFDSVDLMTVGPDVWTPVPGAVITLPEAGTYEVEATLSAAHWHTAAVRNAQIRAQMIDVTAGAGVPGSFVQLAFHSTGTAPASEQAHGDVGTSGAIVTVTGPTQIRIDAHRHSELNPQTAASLTVSAFRWHKIN